MTKRIDLPLCATCDLAVPVEGDKESLWCHGGPPSAFPEIVAVSVQGSAEIKQEKRMSATFPPVGYKTIGCALHPKLRRKIFRGLA